MLRLPATEKEMSLVLISEISLMFLVIDANVNISGAKDHHVFFIDRLA